MSGAIGLKRLLLKDTLNTGSMEVFLLRCYEQIITGLWSLMLLEPVESLVYRAFGDISGADYLSKRYLVVFICYSIFFLVSAMSIPKIRKIRLHRKLHVLTMQKNINSYQRERLKAIVNHNILCKSFFTHYGMIHFVSVTLSNTIFVAAYFTCEFVLEILIHGSRPVYLPVCFICIFVVLIAVAWQIDRYMAKSFKSDTRYKSIIPSLESDKQISGKSLMIEVMQLIAKDSFESNTGRVLIEDFLEDVCQFMYVTNKDKL